MPSLPDAPRRDAGRSGLVLAALCALLSPGVAGAGDVLYFRDTALRIPFSVDAGETRIRSIFLWASEDNGRTYRNVASVGPGDKGFQFQAQHDGFYLFAVQTQDNGGALYPPDQTQLQPQIKVCVDTQRPTVTIRPGAAGDQPINVEWEVRDETSGPDLASLRLEYRPAGGGVWTPVNNYAQRDIGRHGWTPSVNANEFEVRLTARDRAGNAAEAVTRVAPAGGRNSFTSPAEAGTGGVEPPGQPKVNFVNQRSFRLNYTVENRGKSGVQVVEVWTTQDKSRWEKYRDAPPEPPYLITVGQEGRYGITLIARSKAGRAEPAPRPGDEPQIWIEVDTIKPLVRGLTIIEGQGAETGTLTIRWNASDRNLTANPITISYSAEEGKWEPVAKDIANDGTYVWKMPPELPYKFKVRVEAVDRAGNVGFDETRQAIAVDPVIPRAKVISVEPVSPGAATPGAVTPGAPEDR